MSQEMHELSDLISKMKSDIHLSNLNSKDIIDKMNTIANTSNNNFDEIKEELINLINYLDNFEQMVNNKDIEITKLKDELKHYKDADKRVGDLLDKAIQMSTVCQNTSEFFMAYKHTTDKIIQDQKDEIELLKYARQSEDNYIVMLDDVKPRNNICAKITNFFKF